MYIGYGRISKYEQNLDMQIDALKDYGCVQVFTDTASGVKVPRPGLEAALNYIREGDTLVVWRLDRLGRSMKCLIEDVNMLNERGIGFNSLHEKMDTTTAVGKFIFHIFASLAEFERNLIRDRTMAGLKAAAARGKFAGRPYQLNEKQVTKMIARYEEKKLTVIEIAKLNNITRQTFYKYLKLSKKSDGN